jgi:hypothetical protein
VILPTGLNSRFTLFSFFLEKT